MIEAEDEVFGAGGAAISRDELAPSSRAMGVLVMITPVERVSIF
jgi:hypothetical protein